MSMQRCEKMQIRAKQCAQDKLGDVFNVNIHNRIFHARQAENSHDALLYKPISEELIDPSGCIRKCFLLFLFAQVTQKNIPQVI